MGTANMIYVGNLTIFFINDLDCGCTAFSWYFPNEGHIHYCKVISTDLHLVSNPNFNLLRSFLVEIWKIAKVRYYEGMGWDKETGKPLPETLKRYGLEYAVNELWGKHLTFAN
jgi:hypothetical protein